MRGAHFEHAVHVRDAGRVEAQRLVERRRFLPSRKEGMRCRARCGTGGVRAWGGGAASGMHGERDRLKAGGQGTRGAHHDHLVHEAQRLCPQITNHKLFSVQLSSMLKSCWVLMGGYRWVLKRVPFASAITRLGNTVRCGILRWGVGTGGVVDMCTGDVVRVRATKAWYVRASGGVDARGGGSSHLSHLCSFPDPSSSHSQQKRRPRCPPTRNG